MAVICYNARREIDREPGHCCRLCVRARAIRPDVKVVSYIYSYYRHPPRRERIAYPENMVFGIVPLLMDDYRADLAASM